MANASWKLATSTRTRRQGTDSTKIVHNTAINFKLCIDILLQMMLAVCLNYAKFYSSLLVKLSWSRFRFERLSGVSSESKPADINTDVNVFYFP